MVGSEPSAGEGRGGFNPLVASSVQQNDQDLTGPDHSAKITGPSLKLVPGAPKCLDSIGIGTFSSTKHP